MFQHKVKASLLHLLISVIIVGAFLTFALLVWYPSPFLQLSGLIPILLILVSVDLILGPLLTFVVYKPDKPRLRMDLTFIGLVQLAALGYGMHTIYQGHPVYAVFTVDRFTLITAQEAKPDQARYPEYQVSTFGKPVFAYAQKPADPEILKELMFAALSGKPDIDAQPAYYEPFDKFTQTILSGGIASEKLLAATPSQNDVEDFLSEYGGNVDDYAFLPLVGKEEDVIWVWNRASASPVDILNINPWKLEQVASTE